MRRMSDFNKMSEFAAPSEPPKLTVNQQHLKQAWDVSSVSTKEEWAEWIQRLSVEFLKESPSHALRACMSLVDSHQPLARELFNVAFMSCWTELYDQYQVNHIPATVLLANSCHLGGPRSGYRVCHYVAHSPPRSSAALTQPG